MSDGAFSIFLSLTLRVTLDKDAKALKVLRKFTFNSVRFFKINLPEKEKLKQ